MWRAAHVLPLAAAALAVANQPEIAFKQFPGNRQAIVRLDERGGGLVELTRGKPVPSTFGAFSWSPDGSRLVYASQGLVGGDLYSIDADDGGLRRLTAQDGNDDPASAPDGKQIAYVHTERVRQPSGLFRLDEDIWLLAGGAARPLTNDAGYKSPPQWSPDGSRLAYSRYDTGAARTHVVDIGTGRRVLETQGGEPAWSPDGTRLALGAGGGIVVVGADGGGRRTVARGAVREWRWAPDGSRIAFSRFGCGRYFRGICMAPLSWIYVARADGSGERLLAGSTHSEPVWWPDGSRLFLRNSERAYVMNADGTCEQPFGPSRLLLGQPAWRPGATPSGPAPRCADLRITAAAGPRVSGRRVVGLTILNDGNESATGVVLALRSSRRVRPPLRTCTRGAVVRCKVPAIGPGGGRRLTVRFAEPLSVRTVKLAVAASAREWDSDRSSNAVTVVVRR